MRLLYEYNMITDSILRSNITQIFIKFISKLIPTLLDLISKIAYEKS